jgi:hypothetical protein
MKEEQMKTAPVNGHPVVDSDDPPQGFELNVSRQFSSWLASSSSVSI